MTERRWLESLALDGWRFWIEEGRLRYRAPEAAATPETLERLRGTRDGLRRLLSEEPDSLSLAPASWGQRALWFLWKLAPDSTAYLQSMPLTLPAGARAADWHAAAAALVRRHAMLRTRLPERDGAPVQHVADAIVVPWEESGARDWSEADLAAALAASHRRPFDLATEPAIRFHWFDRRDRPVLLVTMHHVACDAWSLEILRRELALAAAAPAASGRAGATYADFARWQAAMLAGPRGARLWEYWRDVLAEPRARLELPLDRARPAIQTYEGTSVAAAWPLDLARALAELARARGLTVYTVLLAGFLAFLHRLTRQDDLIVGTLSAGRSQPEFADVVGYFVEPLAIRVAVEEETTFDALIEAVRRVAGDAMAHADFPFPLLVERLNAERDSARSPLFDVTFNYLSRRADAGAPADALPRAPLYLPQADGKFDLTLTVIDDGDTMSAAFGFNTSLFERATIERWGRALRHFLAAAAAHPEAAVADLPLGPEETGPVLEGRRLDVCALVPVHEAIAAAASRTPDRPAVVAADGVLTYAQLLARATHLAAELRAAGVGADVPVGLRAGRSTEFVVGLLGILLADGAFVPIDPGQPRAIGERALTRAGAAAVVEDGRVTRLAGRAATSGLATLDRLAYVIFTSGSTGEPKGVGVEHRALANYVASIVADLAIERACNHAFVSSLAADLGHTVIWPALVTGGTLHLLSDAAITERDAFTAAMTAGAIDYLKIVPSHLAALVDPAAPALPRRGLFLGGESTPAAWLRRIAAGRCRVFNHYGPTETTVGVMTGEWLADEAAAAATLPLARAVANCRIWLLDERRRPVPSGMPGEVWVSGVPLARGYIGDAPLTSERFAELPGIGRAYRTGDVARVLGDGRILLAGRADRQVKLRGYRVDPPQVESALAALPGVQQAAVLPDADGAGASTLLAWVAMEEAAFDAAGLRGRLSTVLPSYMVPSRILRVDRLPVTANGKLDVRGLRASVTAAAALRPAAAARDVLELRLTRIWADVLDVPGVGVHDDFFESGGHSLRAVQVASRVYDEVGVRLPLAAFFTARTIAGLAAAIRRSEVGDQRLVPLQSRGAAAPLLCFPGAGGGLVYFQHLAAALAPRVPLWGAQPPIGSCADVGALARTFADALGREPRLAPPYRFAGHSFGALVAYETAVLLRGAGVAVEQVIVLDNPGPGTAAGEPVERDDAGWARHIAARIERLYRVDLGTSASGGASAGPDWLLDRLLETGTLPAGTSRDYFRQYVEGYKSNVRAAAEYRPSAPPIDVPLLIVRAADGDAAIDLPASPSPELGWGPYSARGVRAVTARGTHISMLTEPHVRGLADVLVEALEPVSRERSSPVNGGDNV